MKTYHSRKNARLAGERAGVNLPDISVREVTYDNFGELGCKEEDVGRYVMIDAGEARRRREVERTIAELDADRAFKADVPQGPVTLPPFDGGNVERCAAMEEEDEEPAPDPVFGVLHQSFGHARYVAHQHGYSDDQIVINRVDDLDNKPSGFSWRILLNKAAPDLTPADGPLAISNEKSTVATRQRLAPGAFSTGRTNLPKQTGRTLKEIAEAESDPDDKPAPIQGPTTRIQPTVNSLVANRAHSTIEKPVAVVHRLYAEMPGASRKAVIDAAVALGVNIHTAKTQYQVASKNARAKTVIGNARGAEG